MWIEVQTMINSITVGVVCRHPSQLANVIERFYFKLHDIFSDLNAWKRTFYALADFNIDLFKINNCNYVRKHVDNVMSRLLIVGARLIYRSCNRLLQTFVDHIYFNESKRSFIIGVLTSDPRDHFGTFTAVSAKKCPPSNQKL